MNEVQSPIGANTLLMNLPKLEVSRKKQASNSDSEEEAPDIGNFTDGTEEDGEDGNFIKNGKKKLFTVPKKRPDYLRPMREDREYRESERGKYDIDWKGIVERA